MVWIVNCCLCVDQRSFTHLHRSLNFKFISSLSSAALMMYEMLFLCLFQIHFRLRANNSAYWKFERWFMKVHRLNFRCIHWTLKLARLSFVRLTVLMLDLGGAVINLLWTRKSPHHLNSSHLRWTFSADLREILIRNRFSWMLRYLTDKVSEATRLKVMLEEKSHLICN